MELKPYVNCQLKISIAYGERKCIEKSRGCFGKLK